MFRASARTFIRTYSKKGVMSKADKSIKNPRTSRNQTHQDPQPQSQVSSSHTSGPGSISTNPSVASSSSSSTVQQSQKPLNPDVNTSESKPSVPAKPKALKSSGPVSNNYIPFKKFPQIPKEFQLKTTDELYESIYLKPMETSRPNLINFQIPQQYSKEFIKSQLTNKDRAMIDQLDTFMNSQDENEMLQSQLNLIKLYYDKDSFNYKLLPEHPLKKSLSGMINLNPNMDDIDDEYLWNLIPQDKLFGQRFFETEEDKLFKQWEAKIIEKNNQLNESIKLNEMEINKFLKLFNEHKTFLVKKNGRFKLNKQLLKNYKHLKAKGNLPFKLNKNNLDLDFDIEFEIENNDLKLKK